ncbi:hypothetical protein H4R18_005710 [Coemansia javaensis]|uniref:Ketoreductase domain-containing protein n=1 Tax=Coemansia javaensis TaxID=2761396 RepID=A0A9W8H5H3_9FUNG|nr:hypothetical protein H4R18_005710 [Coemansia javaensis]
MSTAVYVVTGATGALGRAIVRALAGPASRHIVLAGRSESALAEVAAALPGDSPAHIVAGADAAQPAHEADAIVARLRDVVAAAQSPSGALHLTLVQCSGTLGDLSRSVDQYAPDEIAAYTTANFVSFATLAARFLAFAKGTAAERIAVVNISSLLAIEPFANWGLYAATRAARDQLMRVAALEHAADPRVKTLSYAPGPLEGSMQATVRATLADPAQRDLYVTMHKDGKLVSPDHSARLVCDLVHAWDFESGAHIDIYDLAPPQD